MPLIGMPGLVGKVSRSGIRYDVGYGSFTGNFSRAQAGGALATYVNDGVMGTAAADVPRFQSGRLLIEGQRSNDMAAPDAFTNTTFYGSLSGYNLAAGAGPSLLSGYTATSMLADGSASETAIRVTSENAAGQPYGSSIYLKNISPQVWFRIRSLFISGGAVQGNSWFNLSTLALGTVQGTQSPRIDVLGGGWLRVTSAGIISGGDPALIDFGVPASNGGTQGTAGQGVLLAFFQREYGAFCSSLILPPNATPLATTRGRDNATLSAQTGARTITGVAMNLNGGRAGDPTIFSLDDGTDNNRITLAVASAGTTLYPRRVTGGAAAAGAGLGAYTPGTPFRFAMINDGVGGASFLMEGGSWVSLTGCPTSTSVGRIGTVNAAQDEWYGEIGRLRCTPGALSQSAAAARMAATPLI